MNQYFYLKIKNNKIKKKFNITILKKIILKKNNLKIFKKKHKNNKFKFKPFIFFSAKNKKINFKPSFILLKFSLNYRKFNLWEKIDYWFHLFFLYNKKKYEDHTVFINFLESKRCFNVLYYLFYFKKKSLNNKLFLEEKKNIKFWIWIFNINTNLTVYFHNVKRFLYNFIKSRNYRYRIFKKNFIRYNLSLMSLRILSYILEENYKEKLLNSSKSKWNSEIKRLMDVQNCIMNNLKKNKYISYSYFFFKWKWKIMLFFYIVVNDIRTTKIVYLWLFRYYLFYTIEVFFKKIRVKLSVFYFNIDNLKCFTKLFKFEKFYFKKKKKKKKKSIKFNIKKSIKNFIENFINLIFLVVEEIINFLNLFVDKYLYNDFKNVLNRSKNHIYPELKVLINYIKNFFKSKKD